MSMAATQESITTPTTRLYLILWGPGDDKLKLLINGLNDRALECLEEFKVGYVDNISIADIEALANKMKFETMRHMASHGLKNLKLLTLKSVGITDDYMAVLAAGLDGNHVLEHLDLSYNLMSANSVCELMKSVNCLKSLHLTGNNFGDEDVAILARNLDGNHVLEFLDLSYNSIHAAGVSDLIKSDCHLKDVRLSTNNIGDEGARAFAKLISNNATIKCIDLSHNYIGSEGAWAVAKGLRSNVTLKSIDLSRNNIGDIGAVAIATTLDCNLTLSTIKLSENSITISGIEALALKLQQNTVNLDLSSSSFSSIETFTRLVFSNPHAKKLVVSKEDFIPQTHQLNSMRLDLSHNIRYGDLVTIVSKFAFLSHLNLSSSILSLSGAMAVVDYVANSDNCQQLKYLDLSFFSPCEHALKLSSSSSGFIVDLAGRIIAKTRVLFVLETMKNYNRVGGVCLWDDVILPDNSVAHLKKAFQHKHKDRLLIFSPSGKSFRVLAQSKLSELV